MTTNQLTLRGIKETERHNRATEQEDRRHNVETETYTAEHYARSDQAALQQAWASASQAETAKGNLAINAINAETQRYAAETNRLTYQESVRHNQAYEVETNRHNVATEQESMRHNTAQERETERHNVVSEDYETTKANAALTQAYAASSQAVTAAGNLASVAALNAAQIANIGSQTLYNMASMNERVNQLEADAYYKKTQADVAKGNLTVNQGQLALNQTIAEQQAAKNQADIALATQKANTEAYLANLKGLEFKAKYSSSPNDDGSGLISTAKKIGDAVVTFFK